MVGISPPPSPPSAAIWTGSTPTPISVLQLLHHLLAAASGPSCRLGGPKTHSDGHGGSRHVLTCILPNLVAPYAHPQCWGCGEGAVIQLHQPQPGPACGCCGFGAGEGGRSAAALCWEMRAEGGAGGRELSADGAGTALGSCGDAAAHRLPDAAKGKKGSPHGFLHCIRVTAMPWLRCKGTCCYWGGVSVPRAVPCPDGALSLPRSMTSCRAAPRSPWRCVWATI